MSQPSAAHSLWLRHDAIAAGERLRATVAALARARRLQLLLDHACVGLLAGLVLATFVVLAARVVPSAFPPASLAVAAVIAALLVALFIGWRRRPDVLDVTIRADLILKLKQRLSTAWEFRTVRGEDDLAERLAAQAVKAGLPLDPQRVFPLRVNRWGRLAPLAAIALLLASVLDLHWLQAPLPQEVDEQVVSEGLRLGAFGRAMQARAKVDKLPRSARQGAQLERLGARMESGALSRSQALERLREMSASLDNERTQALADATPSASGPRGADGGKGSPMSPGVNPEAMPERMLSGPLGTEDTGTLAERLEDLARAGISRRELEEAMKRHQTGDDSALRQMLEKLALMDRAREEQEALRGAGEQVLQARENLGEMFDEDERSRGRSAEKRRGEDPERRSDAAANSDADMDQGMDSESAGDASPSASRGTPNVAGEQRRYPFRLDSGQSGPVMKPESQMREGEEFVAQARVLPRSTRPGVENLQMNSEFASQVEEALSRDDYPAHYKAFVRRYFLNLSQGAQEQRQQPGSAR